MVRVELHHVIKTDGVIVTIWESEGEVYFSVKHGDETDTLRMSPDLADTIADALICSAEVVRDCAKKDKQ